MEYTMLNEYQGLAARTLIDVPQNPIEDKDIMIIWNAIGLSGEVDEFSALLFEELSNTEALHKEFGDIFWYVAALCTKLGFNFSYLVGTTPEYTDEFDDIAEAIALINKYAGAVTEYFKKGIFHGHGVKGTQAAQLLQDFIGVAIAVGESYGVDFDTALKGNIEKLKARYPEGFSSECSINR